MKLITQFIKHNKVFITGLATAVILILQQFLQKPSFEVKPLILALAIGIGGYVGNEFRGCGVSIAGIMGAAGNAVATIAQTGTLNWNQLILSLVIGLLALAAPPPKHRSYEHEPLSR